MWILTGVLDWLLSRALLVHGRRSVAAGVRVVSAPLVPAAAVGIATPPS